MAKEDTSAPKATKKRNVITANFFGFKVSAQLPKGMSVELPEDMRSAGIDVDTEDVEDED